ncbi:MAG TPA: serine hydrolase domain-containing protein [Anaerolineales bacterium]
MTVTNLAEIVPVLEEVRRDYNLPALAAAVARAEDIIAAGATGVRILGGPGQVTPADRFHIGSVTKPMTATVIAALIQAGKLSWNTTPIDLFPEWHDQIHASLREITLQQLLTHRAGIPPFEEDEEIAQLPDVSGRPAEVRRAHADWLLRRGAASPVGEHIYSNAGYGLAAVMAESASGHSWESLMQAELFEPLGMDSAGFGWPARAHPDEPWGHRESEAGFVPHDPNDEYQLPPFVAPAGDVHLNIMDLARFARFHLTGLNGKPALLTAATFEKLHHPNGEYALGWYIQDIRGLPASTHSGSAGTFKAGVLIYPKKDIAVVVAINAAGERVTEARDKLFSLLLRKFGAIT